MSSTEGSNPTPESFQQAIGVKAIEGTENCYSGYAAPEWCGDLGTKAHGGWIISTIFSATREYFNTIYANRNQPDPIGIFGQYLLPIPAGPIQFVIRDIKIGRSQSVVQVEVQQGNLEAAKACALAFVTYGNLATENGPSLPSQKLPLPNRSECDMLISDLFTRLNPATGHVLAFTPRGGSSPWWSPDVGQNARDQWICFADESGGFDVLSLGYVADLVPPMPYNYEENLQAAIMNWDVRTVSIAIDIRRNPKGEKWLLQRAVMNEELNGRFDVDIKVINPDGEIVAIVHQVNISVPRVKTQRTERTGTPSL